MRVVDWMTENHIPGQGRAVLFRFSEAQVDCRWIDTAMLYSFMETYASDVTRVRGHVNHF